VNIDCSDPAGDFTKLTEDPVDFTKMTEDILGLFYLDVSQDFTNVTADSYRLP